MAAFRKVRVKLEFVLRYPVPMQGVGEAGIGSSINDMVVGALKTTGITKRKKNKPYIEAGARLRVSAAR